MKKIISVILAAVMIFSVASVAAFAEAEDVKTYDITFTDLPYDVAPYRTDYPGKFMGYEYGVDYWFTITNVDGTTTDIKGWPVSVPVYEGESLEFTVSVADYIEPSSVRVLAFPTETDIAELYDDITGEPYAQYYIAKSIGDTYGVRPTQDMTVCISEFHMYNDCFMYTFPSSDYYTAKRVQFNEGASTPEEMYTDFEWGNTKVVYVNETMFFRVGIPLNDTKHTYHYDTYQVYYTVGAGSSQETCYLKTAEQTDPNQNGNIVAHYETEDEWVDVYKIEHIDSSVKIKIQGTVTYTFSMLSQFLKDFSLDELDSIDLNSIDLDPLLNYLVRLLILITKILKGFGLSIG